MQARLNRIENNFFGFSLITAPLLFGLSTFYWQPNGEYSITGAVLLALSFISWIPALMGMFALLKPKLPLYAVWALPVALYGCISGINFGMLGYYSTVFSIPHDTYLSSLSAYPVSANLLFFWGGPLFPLSILVLAINLLRTRSIETWAGILLCLGAIAFPAGRISRNPVLAHGSDLLLLLPLVYIGGSYARRRKTGY